MGAVNYSLLLWWFASAAFLLTLALGLLFNIVDRARRARPMQLDRFGSRHDG